MSTAIEQNLLRRVVIEQRKQKMLKRHKLVLMLDGLFDRRV